MAWLSGWSYRKEITITGQSGAGTNYQVEFNIGDSAGGDFHLEGHCTNFPEDIEVTDNDGTTLLKFYIPDKTADPIEMWVKIADDLGSNQTIYIYYGKSGETTNSDFIATFTRGDIFDSYPDGNLAGNDDWTLESGEQDWQVSTDAAKHGTKGIKTSNSTETDAFVNLKTYTSTTERVFGCSIKSSDVTDPTLYYLGASGASQASIVQFSAEYLQAYNGDGAGSGSWVNIVAVSDNTWYNIEVILDHTNDEYDVAVNGTLYTNGGSHWGFRHAPTAAAWLKIARPLDVDALVYFDSWYNRKYTSPEPVFSSAGSEETPPVTGNPYWYYQMLRRRN